MDGAATVDGANRLEPKSERSVALGNTGLPFKHAWVREYRSLGVCGKGASMNGLGSRWRAS